MASSERNYFEPSVIVMEFPVILFDLILLLTFVLIVYSSNVRSNTGPGEKQKQRSHPSNPLFNTGNVRHHPQLAKLRHLISSKRCSHFYFDMGTNMGVQIRKLYQPEHFSKAPVIPIFDKFFGADRKRVCAVGFEPNIAHVSKLKMLEASYELQGFPVVIFTLTGLSHENGIITFYHESDHEMHGKEYAAELSNSIYDVFGKKNSYNVTTIDTGAFFFEHIKIMGSTNRW